MPPKTDRITLRIEPELLKAMQALETERGILVSEQIRRAIRAWLVAEKRLDAPRPARATKTGKTRRR